MRRGVRIATVALAALLSSCGVANFAMNVADRADIQNLFDFLYCIEVERCQAAGETPPRYNEWAKGLFRDRALYAEYYEDSFVHAELNDTPISFVKWASLPEDERPKVKYPKSESRPGRRRKLGGGP